MLSSNDARITFLWWMNVSPSKNWNSNALMSGSVNLMLLLEIMRFSSNEHISNTRLNWYCCNETFDLRYSSNWTTLLHCFNNLKFSISREAVCHCCSYTRIHEKSFEINSQFYLNEIIQIITDLILHRRRLIATGWFVAVSNPLNTSPYVPLPIFLTILYSFLMPFVCASVTSILFVTFWYGRWYGCNGCCLTYRLIGIGPTCTIRLSIRRFVGGVTLLGATSLFVSASFPNISSS